MDNAKEEKKYSAPVSFVIELSDQDIEDMIVTMLEGGIGYWACLDNTGDEFENAPDDEPVSITAANILRSGGTLVFIDQYDDDKLVEMNLDSFINGFCTYISSGRALDIMVEKDNHIGIDLCNFDAVAADDLAQTILLGDVQYC